MRANENPFTTLMPGVQNWEIISVLSVVPLRHSEMSSSVSGLRVANTMKPNMIASGLWFDKSTDSGHTQSWNGEEKVEKRDLGVHESGSVLPEDARQNAV